MTTDTHGDDDTVGLETEDPYSEQVPETAPDENYESPRERSADALTPPTERTTRSGEAAQDGD